MIILLTFVIHVNLSDLLRVVINTLGCTLTLTQPILLELESLFNNSMVYNLVNVFIIFKPLNYLLTYQSLLETSSTHNLRSVGLSPHREVVTLVGLPQFGPLASDA